MTESLDVSHTIVPKSDQLNSEQLLAGPMTIRISGVDVVESAEQPVVVHYEGENGRPYKPCKTMRKLLVVAWGSDARAWVGKAASLFNAPEVKFGGETVGGIRISHLSDIPKSMSVSLTSTRGKKALHKVEVLRDAPSVDHHTEMRQCDDVDTLKAAFKVAFRSSKDVTTQAAYKATYDARMVELTKPAFDEKAAADKLRACGSVEVLDLMADELRDVADEAMRARLMAVYDERRTALEAK